MPEVQKKASDQGSVGLSFEYFWLRGCRGFSRPILKQDKTKPKQSKLKQEFLSSDNSINLQVSINFAWRCPLYLLTFFPELLVK